VFSGNDSAYFGDPVFCQTAGGDSVSAFTQTAVGNIVIAFTFGNGIL